MEVIPLTHTQQRMAGGWQRRSWEDAFADIGARLRPIRDTDGPDAIALYIGNPTAMSAVTNYVSAFRRSLGSTRQFSAMSLDNINKCWVAEEMFGDKSFILQRVGNGPATCSSLATIRAFRSSASSRRALAGWTRCVRRGP